MIIAYWIVAGLLAFAYLFVGGTKLLRSNAQLEAGGMHWVRGTKPLVVKLVGLVEVVGAAGLILPPLFSTAVFLAPLAGVGLILVQAVAIGIHMKMGDLKSLPINIALLLLAFVAAWIGVLTFPLS
ncbi:MAG: DoxX family protein [Aurantimicrobium sp.]|nr:DoxX family protein [Aurantimicrobium sp.]